MKTQIISKHDLQAQQQLVLRADEVRDCSVAGGKAYALARLLASFPEVPKWFVITPQAFWASLSDQQRESLQRQGCTQELLDTLRPSEELRIELEQALNEIARPDEQVAVRSSAVEEDSAEASFAGQLESYLCVEHGDVLTRVVDVWRSGFSARVRAYRQQKGLPGEPKAPAVLIQRMVTAEISGIAFSTDPISGDRTQCVISAAPGYGDRLVGGQVQGDVYRVSDGGIVIEHPGTDALDTLTVEQCREVARLAKKLEHFFGRPQDLEWALAKGRVLLLQSRPITTLGATVRQSSVLTIWDNNNIVESYSGITTPLTFSFARHVYEEVYRQFLVRLGVAHDQIQQHADIFQNMLGYIRGRVYYNLLNWYRVLNLLPGFAWNRRFLDQMLGIQEALPDVIEQQFKRPPPTWPSRATSLLAVSKLAWGIVWNWLALGRTTKRFYQRLNKSLAMPVAQLKTMPLDELDACCSLLEQQLLTRWDAPVLNDFYCMIFFGLSRQALARWAGPDGEALHGEFLQRTGGIVSTEPADRIFEMAALAATDDRLVECLVSGGVVDWTAAIENNLPFQAKYQQYLDRFGDRCVQELKLESDTILDDPTALLRAIGYQARQPIKQQPVLKPSPPFDKLKRLMRGRPVRRLVTRLLIREASRRVRSRENLRFERTRVFGRTRRILVEMGKRFAEIGILDDPRHVFFLELNEIRRAIGGTATTGDLKQLVRIRTEESARYAALPDPPTRFETHGAVIAALRHDDKSAFPSAVPRSGSERRGIACSPGVVRGTARVIVDPSDCRIRPGEILVAKHTDPGWVLLFASAAGVIVERGSLLSHSAIVAREMGIPAVVAVPEVTRWLVDGDLVELDGARGIVRRIAHGETNADAGCQS